MTSIRLPEAMEHRLDALAQMTRRSKSFFIKEALQQYLEDMEDAYIALERISTPPHRFYTTKEVLKHIRGRQKKKRK